MNTAQKEVDARAKEIQRAIVAPYLENTEHQDTIDYTHIMQAVGAMNQLSTQTISDVIDELQGELDGRVEPEAA